MFSRHPLVGVVWLEIIRQLGGPLWRVDYDADKRLFAKLTARCHDTINFRSSNSTGVRPDEQGVRVDEQGCSPRRTFIRESVLDNQDKKDCANKSRPPNRATQLPDDFEPNATNQRVAAEHGVDIHKQLPQFCDYHRAKGSTMKDWHAALNTWIRNAKKFDRSTNHEASGRTRKETPLEAGVRELQEMRERIAKGNIVEWLNGGGDVPFG